jgi:cation:H+ antiporter
VVVIFVASRFVVEQTLYFSQILQVSPFIISLLFIAIGTNIPELSFVVRSAFMKNNQVAFGDYVGSASVNTLLFGTLTLIFGKTVFLRNSYMISLYFLLFGLILFYYFARTKNSISRREGLVLLLLYVAFLATEIYSNRVIFIP